MAYSQSDIDALETAIATGALLVKFGAGADSREVRYRSLAEMKQILSDMKASVSGQSFSPVTFAAHTRD